MSGRGGWAKLPPAPISGMSSNAQITQFTVADTDALLAFLREAYPDDPRKSEPAYWKWHYLENPYTDLDDVPLWVLKDAGRIVGQVATIPVALKVGAEERRAIWILDFIVHENYRGQRWGRRLLDTAREHCRTMIALGINAGSTGVLNSQKWAAMGSINRYHLLLNPGHALKELSRARPLGGLVNLAYAPLRARAGAPAAQGVSLRVVEQFDAEFDDLWQRASSEWPCAVVRRARYLDWQFARQPGKRYETLGLYAGGRLAGYIVLFFRKPERAGAASPKVAISDLCYDARAGFDVIDELLRAALDLALERRAGSLVTDVLDARVEERLVRRGFWRIKRAPGFMVYSETERELINDPRNWFLTRADSDVSIFEHPNL
ncbi:MAG TPA: GNAT family N-acetyltransferase [Pyrinomonadaceae bacterium]|nr:GNAT family N-acetyltransferase [Pyrinomonadaceae bacterium]